MELCVQNYCWLFLTSEAVVVGWFTADGGSSLSGVARSVRTEATILWRISSIELANETIVLGWDAIALHHANHYLAERCAHEISQVAEYSDRVHSSLLQMDPSATQVRTRLKRANKRMSEGLPCYSPES